MDCIAFKNWLKSRDSFDISLLPEQENHLKACETCRKVHGIDKQIETMVLESFETFAVPDSLVQSFEIKLDARKKKNFSRKLNYGYLIPAGVMLLIVTIFTHLMITGNTFGDLQHLSDHAVQDHLKGNYKLTFNAQEAKDALSRYSRELGFKVVLPELDAAGYTLLGGRRCVLGKCDVVYLVYQKDGAASSLFILDSDHLGFQMGSGGSYKDVIKGCCVKIWKENGQVYALVG